MKKYNIGLDIGNASVGWAVVEKDTNKIIRKFNKKLWGVRLFEIANTAEETRGYRSTRRRYDRRRKRIKLLNQEFMEEIEKKDPLFFQKVKETFYNRKKDLKNKTVPITKQEKEQIKNYHKKYPTIYHLRNELINNKEQKDIRLVYLALHHIIKYRGNFLYEGNLNINNLNMKEKLKETLNSLINLCDFLNITEDEILNFPLEEFENIMKLDSKNDQKLLLKKYFEQIFPKNIAKELTNAFTGATFKISFLLDMEPEEDLKINFKDNSYEEKYSLLEKELGSKIEIVAIMKELYDMLFLKTFFSNEETTSISQLMMQKYNQHKKDLKALKELFVEEQNEFNKLFKNPQSGKCLYEKYITNELNYEEFNKEINSLLETMEKKKPDKSNQIQKIQERLEKGDFLPRITSKENGKYPYQLHEEELKKIIENQGVYYPFLLKKTTEGEYRLQKLLKFRIPYYVGPLNNTTHKKNIQNKNAWMIKKNKEQITPYNFNEIVDLEESAQIFIERMISHCTYLLEEPALPNNSILYSKFKVLNELKQIKINDYPITQELRIKIYQNLFLKESKSITDKKLKQFLLQTDECVMYNGDFTITGYSSNGKFANNMGSYIDFFGENGILKDTEYTIEDAENFIKWITIFESKDILERKIKKEYPTMKENIRKKILSKNYSGWGRLSKKLLTTKYYKDKSTGIPKSIIDILETTNQNFMQIINDQEYNFQKMIAELNYKRDLKKINYELVENLATSPANKRGIYQALKILEEIIHYMGYEPENIIVEMARSEEQKKRKEDRKKQITTKLTENKNSIENIKQLLKELKDIEKLDEKLTLYFYQEGKSLYSGKPLNILKLEECEIDHIIPQSLKKDDSFENKALVYRCENQDKAAAFVLPEKFRNKDMKEWWNHLKNIGLMTDRKYNNLCRSNYKDSELEGFINRQLVETRQVTKHVANIIKNYYKQADVIYLHADLSHNYREKFELYKYRQLNDFHHAHDAYLAAVLGEYKKTHLKEKINFEKLKEQNKKYYDNQEYQKMKYGYVINSLDNNFVACNEETGEILFDADEFNKTIKKTLYQNDILITKKKEIRTGAFYDETKQKATAKLTKPISLKENLPTEIYGSYKTLYPSYAMLIKYQKKEKEYQKMIGMTIYHDKKAKVNPNIIDSYIRDILKLEPNDKYEIIKDKIPFFTELEWEGKKCFLVGANEKVEICNAKELIIDSVHLNKWKYTLNKLLNKKTSNQLNEEQYKIELTQILQYILAKIKKQYILFAEESKTLKNLDLTNLALEQLEQLIIELLNLTKCNSRNANLKVINLSDRVGRKSGKTISHGTIIHKSITGIKEWKDEF